MAMMLSGGDGRLSRSVKEAMKQAVLRQEAVFRGQVRELHRLYWTQKNLVRELYRKETAAEEQRRRLKEKSVTGEVGSRKRGAFELELSADEYIRSGGASAEGEVVAGSSAAAERNFGVGGGDGGRKRDGYRVNAENVIDLENAETDAEDNLRGGRSERRREPMMPNPSGAGFKCSTLVPYAGLTPQKQLSTARKPTPLDLNIADNDDESLFTSKVPVLILPSPSTSSSVVRQGDFQTESGNRNSNEISLTRQSDNTYPTSSVSWENNANWLHNGYTDFPPCSIQSSAQNTNEASLSPIGSSKQGQASADLILGQRHSIVCDSTRQASIVTFSNNTQYNNLPDTVGSAHLPATVNGGTYVQQTKRDGSEEYTVSSHVIAQREDQQEEIEKNAVGNKSNQICGENHFGLRDTFTERHVFSGSKDSESTRLDSLGAESFSSKQAPFPETCDQTFLQDVSCKMAKSKPYSCKQQETHGTEMDSMVAEAAETLLSISLGNSACSAYQFTSADCVERSDGSQYSSDSDSFESITLKLSETRDDVCLVPTTSAENEVGTNACSVKLRRGGLRDFQKNVLPGLASLSRHEIREDMHVLDCELGKNGSGKGRSIPVRKRRSRLHRVSRKR